MNSQTLASVTFEPIPDDYEAVYAITLTQSTNDARWKAGCVVFLASYLTTFTTLLAANALSLLSVGLGAALSIIFAIFFTSKLFARPEKRARAQFTRNRNPLYFRPRTLQFEDLGVRHISESAEMWFSWQIVRRTMLTQEHFFLSTNSTMVFVPARVFATREDFLAFVKIAQERYVPAQDQSKPLGFEVIMKTETSKES